MPNEDFHVDLNKLPVNPDTAERGPANPTAGTPAMPSDDLVAKVSRESMMADRHAAAAAQVAFVPPQLDKVEVVQPPPKPVITVEERAVIMELAKKRRGRPPKIQATTPPPPPVLRGPVIGAPPSVNQCATILINHFRTLSAEWSAKIDAMRTERQLDDLNCVVSLMANALDTGQYLVIPVDHENFQGGISPAGTNFTCLICGKIQNRVYAGQPPLCSEAGAKCPPTFYALSKEDQQELLAEAS